MNVLVGAGKTISVPFADMILIVINTVVPIFSTIIQFWQVSSIIWWQQIWVHVFMQTLHIFSMEIHLKMNQFSCYFILNFIFLLYTKLTLPLSFSRMKGLNKFQTMLKMKGCLIICTSLSLNGIASWMKVSNLFENAGDKAATCFKDNPLKSMMTTTPQIWLDGSKTATKWIK